MNEQTNEHQVNDGLPNTSLCSSKTKAIVWVHTRCVCICMHACMRACVPTCVCVHACVCISEISSHAEPELMIWLEQLATKLQGRPCLQFLVLGWQGRAALQGLSCEQKEFNPHPLACQASILLVEPPPQPYKKHPVLKITLTAILESGVGGLSPWSL